MDEEIGYVHIGLRQYDQAVEAFERLTISGTLYWSALRNPVFMDEMRDHARFRALLSRVGTVSSHSS